MAVYKRFNGKKIAPNDPNWERGTWYIRKKIGGRIYNKAIRDAKTETDALKFEKQFISKMSRKMGLTTSAQIDRLVDQAPHKRPTYIYILESGGYYKIGITTDLTSRIKTIAKTIIPFETHLVIAVQHGRAAELEKKLHADLEACRVRGEWFDLPDYELAAVKRRMISDDENYIYDSNYEKAFWASVSG